MPIVHVLCLKQKAHFDMLCKTWSSLRPNIGFRAHLLHGRVLWLWRGGLGLRATTALLVYRPLHGSWDAGRKARRSEQCIWVTVIRISQQAGCMCVCAHPSVSLFWVDLLAGRANAACFNCCLLLVRALTRAFRVSMVYTRCCCQHSPQCVLMGCDQSTQAGCARQTTIGA